MNNTYFWTKKQTNKLKKIYEMVDMDTLVKSFNKSRGAISAKARRLSLTHKTRVPPDTIRKNYFKKIDNQTKAYILGLIASDGCVHKSYLMFTSKDEVLVNFVKDNLSPLAKIYLDKRNKAFKFHISCKKMVEDLKQWNIYPRKSLTYKFPKKLNPKMYKAFILGYFDGDGSYCIVHDRGYKHKYWNLCGTKEFLNKIKNIVKNEINITPNGPYNIKGQNHYFIAASHKRAIKINNWLIKNSRFFLCRKHI